MLVLSTIKVNSEQQAQVTTKFPQVEILVSSDARSCKEQWPEVEIQEPLSADSPLWELPNVIITPHIGGWSADYKDRCLKVFSDNLGLFLGDRSFVTPVDLDKGY